MGDKGTAYKEEGQHGSGLPGVLLRSNRVIQRFSRMG